MFIAHLFILQNLIQADTLPFWKDFFFNVWDFVHFHRETEGAPVTEAFRFNLNCAITWLYYLLDDCKSESYTCTVQLSSPL